MTRPTQATAGPGWEMPGKVRDVLHYLTPKDRVLATAAPQMREALDGMLGVLRTMDRSYKPEQIFVLLDKWADVARTALRAANGETEKEPNE